MGMLDYGEVYVVSFIENQVVSICDSRRQILNAIELIGKGHGAKRHPRVYQVKVRPRRVSI
jgi:hypothetical protein